MPYRAKPSDQIEAPRAAAPTRSTSGWKRPLTAMTTGVAAVAFVSIAAAQTVDAPLQNDPLAQDDALENGREPAPSVESPLVDQRPSLEAPFAPSPDDAPDEEEVRKQATNGMLIGPGVDNADGTDELAEAPTPEERLEQAFERLASSSEDEWRAAQEEIAKAWSKSGSPTADLLLVRGRRALEREAWDEAETHFSDLVNLAPDFAEGWNMRATLYFRQKEFGRSLADIAETLAREPRHFGALSGLGIILEALDYEDEAFAAFKQALEIHPHLESALEAVKRLQPKTEGVGI